MTYSGSFCKSICGFFSMKDVEFQIFIINSLFRGVKTIFFKPMLFLKCRVPLKNNLDFVSDSCCYQMQHEGHNYTLRFSLSCINSCLGLYLIVTNFERTHEGS